jgi:hypothetical protein
LLSGAARIQEKSWVRSIRISPTLNNLAIVAEKTGSSSEAETLYRRAAAIAAAALPADHPMVVASRQNLEDFCRARGLSIDAPAVVTPTPDAERKVNASASKTPSETGGSSAVRRSNPGTPATTAARSLPPAPTPSGASHWLKWVATGAVVLAAAALLVLRPWAPRDTSSTASTTAPAAAQPADATPPRMAAPAPRPAPTEQARPPAAAPPRRDGTVATATVPVPGITVATAQLCGSFSTSGSSWRCDPVDDSAMPGPMVFYTRVRSPRDTTVVHRWYHGSTLRQSVMLTIQANATEGYRTFSRLTLDEGDWRLEIRSVDGSLLYEHRLAVR